MKKILSIPTLLISLLLVLSPLAQAVEIDALTSDNPVDYTPRIQGTWVGGGNYHTVLDYAQDGENIYAGGIISDVKSASGQMVGTFSNLIRFNINTGEVDTTFNPQVKGPDGTHRSGEIVALAMGPDNTSLFFGGFFTSVNGVPIKGLAKWDLVNNQLDTTFNAQLGAGGGRYTVYDLKMFKNQLFVGTNATSIGGAQRTALASVDPVTGQATDFLNLDIDENIHPTQVAERVYKMAIHPKKTHMVIIGNFKKVANQDRKQIAMIKLKGEVASLAPWYARDIMDMTTPAYDATSETLLPNNCNIPVAACLRDVDWSNDGAWFALAVTGGSNESYPGITDAITAFKFNNQDNNQPYWQNTSGADTFHSVRIVGKHVYTGGHNKRLDVRVYFEGQNVSPRRAEFHYGLGLINANTGKAVNHWNPADDESITSRGEGWRAMLWIPGKGLLVGGDGDFISSEYRQRIGLLPIE